MSDPGLILTLAGGAMFGLAEGAERWYPHPACFGASAAFFIGRHVAREWDAASAHPRPGPVPGGCTRPR